MSTFTYRRTGCAVEREADAPRRGRRALCFTPPATLDLDQHVPASV